jgi:hypothetical protein
MKVTVEKNYIELNYNQKKVLKIKTTMFYKHDLNQKKVSDPMTKFQIRDSLMDNLIYTFQ